MIEPEKIELPIEDARALVASARLERQPAGYWVLVLDLDGQCSIDETRKLNVNREVRISRLVQVGRRPHPNAINKKDGR